MIIFSFFKRLLFTLILLLAFACDNSEADIKGKYAGNSLMAEQSSAAPATLVKRKLNTDTLRIHEILTMMRIWTSAEEFKAFWLRSGMEPVPEVNFQKERVIGIFIGNKPNAGYALRINKVTTKGDKILIEYHNILPEPNMDYPAMIVYPYELFIVESTANQAFFKAHNVQ